MRRRKSREIALGLTERDRLEDVAIDYGESRRVHQHLTSTGLLPFVVQDNLSRAGKIADSREKKGAGSVGQSTNHGNNRLITECGSAPGSSEAPIVGPEERHSWNVNS